MTTLSSITDCVLFVDMPNLGGGTTFFVNSLISHFSPKTTFLVARNFNRKLQLSINNTTILKKTYSKDESVEMLDKIKDKISFIFVNHIIKHTKAFLQKLFKLNKRVVGITHDYLLLFSEPQFTFEEYLSKNFSKEFPLQNKLNINQFDSVITQNIGNMYIYHKYMTKDTQEHVTILGLPDYTKSLEKIKNDNNSDSDVVKVGILGNISYIKGSLIVKEFIKKTKKTNVQLVVFGSIEDSDYPHQYPYKGIAHLNRLLIEHKPNVMIETSICPETYSYTLTLAMLTHLPILYYKKPIPCVVAERLSHYKKSHECKNVEEMIKYAVKLSQPYLYTIDESSFAVNSEWDAIFI